MLCNCGDSSCCCSENCLCPIEMCVCIICMKIRNNAKSEVISITSENIDSLESCENNSKVSQIYKVKNEVNSVEDDQECKIIFDALYREVRTGENDKTPDNTQPVDETNSVQVTVFLPDLVSSESDCKIVFEKQDNGENEQNNSTHEGKILYKTHRHNSQDSNVSNRDNFVPPPSGVLFPRRRTRSRNNCRSVENNYQELSRETTISQIQEPLQASFGQCLDRDMSANIVKRPYKSRTSKSLICNKNYERNTRNPNVYDFNENESARILPVRRRLSYLNALRSSPCTTLRNPSQRATLMNPSESSILMNLSESVISINPSENSILINYPQRDILRNPSQNTTLKTPSQNAIFKNFSQSSTSRNDLNSLPNDVLRIQRKRQTSWNDSISVQNSYNDSSRAKNTVQFQERPCPYGSQLLNPRSPNNSEMQTVVNVTESPFLERYLQQDTPSLSVHDFDEREISTNVIMTSTPNNLPHSILPQNSLQNKNYASNRRNVPSAVIHRTYSESISNTTFMQSACSSLPDNNEIRDNQYIAMSSRITGNSSEIQNDCEIVYQGYKIIPNNRNRPVRRITEFEEDNNELSNIMTSNKRRRRWRGRRRRRTPCKFENGAVKKEIKKEKVYIKKENGHVKEIKKEKNMNTGFIKKEKNINTGFIKKEKP